MDDHVQRIPDAPARVLCLRAGDAALVQRAKAPDHFQRGGQVIVHEFADLRGLGGFVVYRAEYLGAQVFQLLQLIGEGGIGNAVVFRADFRDHAAPLLQQRVHIGITGVALHLLQAFRGLDGGTHVQPLRHDADDRARKQAQRRGQRKSAHRVRAEQKGKQREHHAERDDPRAQPLALFGRFRMAHLACSFYAARMPGSSARFNGMHYTIKRGG